MQEHQQKQLELILAIGKAAQLLESKKVSGKEQLPSGSGVPIPGKKENQELEAQSVDNNRIWDIFMSSSSLTIVWEAMTF